MKVLLKKWVLLNKVVLLFSVVSASAQGFQNLVPNGSFESFTQCPSGSDQIYSAVPWTGPRINSSDYFNACSSSFNVPHYGGIGSFYPYYLKAKDGVAYAGIYYYRPNEDNREYAQVELLDTLKSGVCYYVEFYAANSQGPPYAANNVAANLSATWYTTTTLVVNNSILNITSHITNYGNPILPDTVKWHKISGIYEALGIEKYLIIGNFATNAQTDTVRIFRPVGFANCAYLHLDAVSVYSINPTGQLPWAYRDTSIAKKGDSVFIGNKMGGLNFHPKWYKQDGTFIKTHAGITVSPTVTTKYYIQYTLCGVQRTDTVKVTVPGDNEVALNEYKNADLKFKIWPNPADDFIEVETQRREGTETQRFLLFNSLGQLIREEEIELKNGKAKLTIKELDEGIYILQLQEKQTGLLNKRFVISR